MRIAERMATCVEEDNVRQHVENILGAIGDINKSLTIVAVGKPGCGKSTLIGDILGPDAKEKPKVGSGKEPVTTETTVHKIQVGDVSVVMCDTRGLFDTAGGDHEKVTIGLVREICTNDRSGVVLICMAMHERLDAATAQTLALLHERCGPEIWRYVVIVLTKANQYPKDDWLDKKEGRWEASGTVLKREFENSLADNRQSIQRMFTDTTCTKEMCRIGMSKEDFISLQIPILPVARLNSKDAVKRMENVGYGSWFTILLYKCTMRESDVGLISIHKDRLSSLPHKIEKLIKEQIDPQLIEAGRKIECAGKKISGTFYLIVYSKAYWWRNRKKMICGARFEKGKKAL